MAKVIIFTWIKLYPDYLFKKLWSFLDNQYININLRVKAFNKLHIFKQKIRSFRNFINEFERLVLEARRIFNNNIKKNLYKKVLNKWLINAVLDIDNTLNFKTYKVCFIVINDYITRFNNNYKKFLFGTILKSEYIKPAIKSAKKDIIK